MAFYLGIYSKKGKVEEHVVHMAVTDFHQNGTRPIHLAKYPGFQLHVVEKFRTSLIEEPNSTLFLAGWIQHDELQSSLIAENLKQIREKYIQKFENFLSQSEGTFSLIHYDSANHILHLANDKFGMSPVFIFENDDYLIFSNEYEPLTHMPKGRIVNPMAVAEYFSLGTTLAGKTFLKNIQNLAPANSLRIDSTNTTFSSYWKPVIEKSSLSIEELACDTWNLFKKVNQEIFTSQKIETALLSAGADSRLILASLSEEQRNNVRFYTSNLSHLSEEEDQDVVGAKLLAKKFNLTHVIEKISYYENEFGGNYFSNWRILRFHQVYGGWHGGEFLGGFSLKAAPIQNNLVEKEIKDRYKSIFSRKFRRSVNLEPWQCYLQSGKVDLLFCMSQFTQAFFTTIYGGARGHWLQPFQLVSHGYSPFWDSRIIQQVLTVPIEFLKDYRFYNEVMKNAPYEFLEIGSNSPLTNRADSIIPKLNIGVEPKHQLPDVHHLAHLRFLNNQRIWDRKFYKKKGMRKTLSNESDPISKRWLDFEVWLTDYMNL
jgi:Glutamine amidotransferase domain